MYSGRVECIPRAACLWRAVVSVVWWQGSPLAVVSSWRAQCKCLIMRCLLVSGALIVGAAGDSYARAAAITTSTERRSLRAVAWKVPVVVARVAQQLFFKLFKLWDLRGAIFQQRPKCSALGLPYVALLIRAARCTHAATTDSDFLCLSLRRCALNVRWIADRGVVAAAAQINNCSCSTVANQHVWGRHSNSKQYLWRAG